MKPSLASLHPYSWPAVCLYHITNVENCKKKRIRNFPKYKISYFVLFSSYYFTHISNTVWKVKKPRVLLHLDIYRYILYILYIWEKEIYDDIAVDWVSTLLSSSERWEMYVKASGDSRSLLKQTRKAEQTRDYMQWQSDCVVWSLLFSLCLTLPAVAAIDSLQYIWTAESDNCQSPGHPGQIILALCFPGGGEIGGEHSAFLSRSGAGKDFPQCYQSWEWESTGHHEWHWHRLRHSLRDRWGWPERSGSQAADDVPRQWL